MSARAAEAQREQASPYTHEDVAALLRCYFASKDDPAIVLSIGFFLALSFACLRWADLFRSKHLALTKDTIYGTSWRVKKRGVTPWAAMGHTWVCQDWTEPWITTTQADLPAETASQGRGWTWPRMALEDDKLRLATRIKKEATPMR